MQLALLSDVRNQVDIELDPPGPVRGCIFQCIIIHADGRRTGITKHTAIDGNHISFWSLRGAIANAIGDLKQPSEVREVRVKQIGKMLVSLGLEKDMKQAQDTAQWIA